MQSMSFCENMAYRIFFQNKYIKNKHVNKEKWHVLDTCFLLDSECAAKRPIKNLTDDGSLGFPKMFASKYCIASQMS